MLGFLKKLFGKNASEQPAPTILPPIEDEAAYRAFIGGVLNTATSSALAQLHKAIDHLPLKTQELLFGIHLAQEEDGGFEIRLHAAGSDQYVLNKAISDWAQLFEGRTISWGDQPAKVPCFDPQDLPFDVSTAIAETSRDWIIALWEQAQLPDFALPARIFSEDGFTQDVIRPTALMPK